MKFFILGGCPRSGTTGLMNFINATSNAGLFPEYNLERTLRSINLLFYKEANISRKSWIKDINNSVRNDIVEVGKFLKYIPRKDDHRDKYLKKLFELVFEKDCQIIGEKYPKYWQQDLSYLFEELPSMEILHIFRNPKDVMLSYQHRVQLTKKGLDEWSSMNKYLGFLDQINSFETFLRLRSEGKKIIALKYEDLQKENSESHEKISAFFGIEDRGHILLPNKGQRKVEMIDEDQEEIFAKIFGDIINIWDSKKIDEILDLVDVKLMKSKIKKHLWRTRSLESFQAILMLSNISSNRGIIPQLLSRAKYELIKKGIYVNRI